MNNMSNIRQFSLDNVNYSIWLIIRCHSNHSYCKKIEKHL